jgi:hypothetical protein
MATKFGYVRDKQPLSINWAEISKSFNDRLAADEAERQSKREDIQKQYDDLSKELINRPVGYNTDLNDVIASYSTQASQSALTNLNKLKSGEITEQEYYNRRANLKSSTENFFLYANNFNQKLNENMKLIQSQDPNNKGSDRMAFQLALAQDMLNFKNTKAIIDPATDELILVKTDAEGNPTNEIIDVTQLGYLSSLQEKSYNYKQKVNQIIEGKGTKKYRDSTGKEVITILGAEINSEQAAKTIDSIAESLLGGEPEILSILSQNGYKYTQDESLKGKDGFIYYDIKNNTYDYDKSKAKDILVEDIKSAIPETILEPKAKTENELEIERLQIENLQNQVELGKVKVNEARARDIDTSNLQPQLNADIQKTIGPAVVDLYKNNFTGLRESKKYKNAIDATLELLNRYGAGFATTIERDGDVIRFTTPAYDASGKELKTPQEEIYSIENIKSGETLNALLEAFIINYTAPQFINNAYQTGKFKQPLSEETVVSEETETLELD